ncbi:MAG: LuxR C-terminal-related transcriptional regulator, partial [Ilumatobacteraceae bacterium]
MSRLEPPNFSAREHDVWCLIAEGLTNEAIASRLSLAPKTIEAVVGGLFVKLGLHDSELNKRVLATRWFLGAWPHEQQRKGERVVSSTFVGRARELEELACASTQHRLVTITGIGGIGKTSLALELMRRWKVNGARVRFVDLVGSDELSCHDRFLGAFGLTPSPGRSFERALHRALRAERTSLIVDNAEHVSDVVRDVVCIVLQATTARVLVTSRRPLGIDGEFVWNAPPLGSLEALQLLVTRLVASASAGTDDADVLKRWCEQTDGIPLAIELAAHHLARRRPPPPVVNGPAGNQLLDETRGRQTSLAKVLDETFGSLSPTQRNLLERFAPFRTGIAIDSALQFFSAYPDDVLEHLDALASTGLLMLRDDRYRMLEPVRQHALSRLAPSELREVADSFVDWVVDFTADVESGFLHQPALWRSRLQFDLDNVDAALETCLTTGRTTAALTIIRHLWVFLPTQGAVTAARRVERVVARLDGSETATERAWALLACGRLMAMSRRDGPAIVLLTRALEDFAAAKDERGVTTTQMWLGRTTNDLVLVEDAMHDARRLKLDYVEAWACMTLVHHRMRGPGRYADHVGLIERASEIGRRARLPRIAAYASLLRAESQLQANWLGEGSFHAAEIDALTGEMEAYVRDAGGVVD